MRRCNLLALLLATALLLSACAASAEEPSVNPITFYYCRAEGNYSSDTGALAGEQVDLGRTDVTVDDILQRYLHGPSDDSLLSPFPAGLACTEQTLDGGVLTLRFNEALAELSGVDLTLACACLTMTLTQIEFVDAVRVASPGTALAAQTDVVLTDAQFLLFDETSYHPERAVTLYGVGRADGLLYASTHTVSYSSGDQLPLLALQALFEMQNVYTSETCIPPHTQLIDLSVSDGLCTLVLSDSFSDCDKQADTAVGAVRQIVATLCAFDEISAVNISLLDGSTLKNVDLSQSFTPEDSWFAAP